MYILLYIYTILFLSFLGSAFGTFINLILYYIFESVDVESTLSLYTHTKNTFLVAWLANLVLFIIMIWYSIGTRKFEMVVGLGGQVVFCVVTSIITFINYRWLREPIQFEE
ncbi:hypothetical protein CA264_11375 [Pontibacter actiniarum]|uniref:Uncharacterized protein n=1 Tax=Pontibacter actiniarum TaxID=323450 RepID=A0A1X9YT06_9BACT|nr:hypothetical protein CA264_11375 [Pontibacter actiniarum]